MSSRRLEALGLVTSPPAALASPPRLNRETVPVPAAATAVVERRPPAGALPAVVTLVLHFDHGTEETLRVWLCSQHDLDAAGGVEDLADGCVVTLRQLLNRVAALKPKLDEVDARCLGVAIDMRAELLSVVPAAMRKSVVEGGGMSTIKLTLHLYTSRRNVPLVAKNSITSPVRALLETLSSVAGNEVAEQRLASKAQDSPRKAVGYRSAGPFSSPPSQPDLLHIAKLHPSLPSEREASEARVRSAEPTQLFGSSGSVAVPPQRLAMPVEAPCAPSPSPPRSTRVQRYPTAASSALETTLAAHALALRRDTIALGQVAASDIASRGAPKPLHPDVVRRWIDAAKVEAEGKKAASQAAEAATTREASSRSRTLTTFTA